MPPLPSRRKYFLRKLFFFNTEVVFLTEGSRFFMELFWNRPQRWFVSVLPRPKSITPGAARDAGYFGGSGENSVAKLLCAFERARLIQGQAPTRNVDSKIYSLRFR
jgi:hypothetical protein